MKRSDFIKTFRTQRIREEGTVYYTAKCPVSSCEHEGTHTVLYGNESGAQLAAESDIVVHCRIVHHMDIEDDNDTAS